MNASSQSIPEEHPDYTALKADYYLQRIEGCLDVPLDPQQLSVVRATLESAIPAPSPKLVDMRVNVDLIFSRFYIVLFVGKDRRKKARPHTTTGFTAIANKVAAVMLLLGLNLALSLFVFIMAYLIKSALGINLFAKHLGDYLFH